MIVLQANFDFDRRLIDADELLARYSTLTGWSEALLEAGAARVIVLQRFHDEAVLTRNGVEYVFFGGARVAPLGGRRIDIAHVNGLGFPTRTRLMRAWLPSSVPIVVQDHASGAPPANAISRALGRASLRSVDAFMFTADEQAGPWRAAGLIRRSQKVYHVLEASTTLGPLARALAREMSGVDGAPAVLWVGRINANKDPLTVLAGFERALARLPSAALTMVFGADDLLPEVKGRIAASPALARRVRLVGQVPHHLMPAYYSAADLFVLGSHHEGSGYALLEACACGAVPVVTSIPAFRVITGNGACGALWTPGDAAGLARALVDTARRDLTALRAAVASRFGRELSWPAVGRRAMDIYADLRDRRRRSR